MFGIDPKLWQSESHQAAFQSKHRVPNGGGKFFFMFLNFRELEFGEGVHEKAMEYMF